MAIGSPVRALLRLGIGVWLSFVAVSGAWAEDATSREFSEVEATTLGPRGESPALKTQTLALEQAIDPDAYQLGPGDRLMLSIWGDLPSNHDLAVNLEGKLLIPGVGVFDVQGMSLTKARVRVNRALRSVFLNSEYSLNLARVRTFRVFVSGAVGRPGLVEATPLTRVSDVIASAGGIDESGTSRLIRVKRRDGSFVTADLTRYARTGNMNTNPYIAEGDRIRVPYRRASVWVRGAVNNPGRIDYVAGEVIADAIHLAGGLRSNARTDSLEVARFDKDGVTVRRFYVLGPMSKGDPTLTPPVVSKAQALTSLRPDDQIFVRARPEWHESSTVSVGGEMRMPGAYVIREGVTRLSEVIEMAGGYTTMASVREASVRRPSVRPPDPEISLIKSLDQVELLDRERDQLRADAKVSGGLFFIDFARLSPLSKNHSDPVLLDGDVIQVPRTDATITVAGEVQFPGGVGYRSNQSVNDYVDSAGGYLWNARRNRVRIIRGGTGEWMRPKDVDEILPGDAIWVPEKPERDLWGILRSGLSLAAQAATVYIVADRISQ